MRWLNLWSVLVFLLININRSMNLECFTNFCGSGTQKICRQQCTGDANACIGQYGIDADSVVQPLFFQCVTANTSECLSTRCELQFYQAQIHHCCCRGDLCNIIEGVHTGVTLPPQGTFPTPSGTPPLGTGLVCEVFSETEHLYKVCSTGFCQATYKFINGLYELESKSCVETSASCNDTSCVLGTSSTAVQTSCCCTTYLCNQYTSLQFSDVTAVRDYVHTSECDTIGCSHACAITDGTAKCVCKEGYAIDEDGVTCVDVDECVYANCSHMCTNTVGSFECMCPLGMRLQDNGLTCEGGGLECYDTKTLSTVFCDEFVPLDDEDLSEVHIPECLASYRLHDDGTFTAELLSCFLSTVENRCLAGGNCVLAQHSTLSDVFTCCCTEHLCNLNVSYPDLLPTNTTTQFPETTTLTTVPTPVTNTTTQEPGGLPVPITLFLVVIGIFVIIFIVVVVAVVLILCWCRRRSQLPLLVAEYDQPLVDFVDDIDMGNDIGHGRFATVVHATMRGGVEVAVKVFKSKDSFEKERDIYTTSNFSHKNVLKFITAIVRPNEYWLITEYHKQGSLHLKLINMTLSIKEFCLCTESIAEGVSYIHAEISKNGEVIKPSIAHRDLKSKNILVKTDGTCCISDFGLGIKFPLKDANEGHGQVGTSRYMAPEVLEGAIVFNRQAYKQIDNYALGVIVYEILSRTATNGEETPSYRPPFDERANPQPSIEEMRALVCNQHFRPTIPERFQKDAKFDRVVETIQDAWDGDANARLSADMVFERIRSFRTEQFCDKTTDSGLDLDAPSTPSSSPYDKGFQSHMQVPPPSLNYRHSQPSFNLGSTTETTV